MTGSASFSGTHPSLSLSSLSRGERAFEREFRRRLKEIGGMRSTKLFLSIYRKKKQRSAGGRGTEVNL